ncbi:protein FAR1-RELATED SEQUENCE 9-like [Tripterygium wilfordii]|uniref:protein FAR1-RELATED SEQUENCE 9-like n=1 Tax=Tripterygium wilfordii TaxID=458696 RepID=UPI0018F81D84|nr:protein FAR1-RELATED SEQUENCE 9-like [Tripterygium wilfordii]
MSSSQRAESCHAFFKSYVSKKNTLMDFVVRFSRALKRQRHQELCLDHKDINEQPVMKTMFGVEKSLAELFTHTMFYKVQEELFQSMAYMATFEHESGNLKLYNVQRVEGSQKSARKVIEDKPLNYMTCSCRKFESYGIICRHIFSAFSKILLHQPLPDIYVLRRWTKAAKSLTVGGGDGQDNCDRKVILKHNTLRRQASNIIEAALINEDIYNLTFESFESLQCKINSMTLNDGGQSSTPSLSLSKVTYNEPEKVRAKGCGKRLKGGKEIATKNPKRRCNGCGLAGQSHDKRNCPLIMGRMQ